MRIRIFTILAGLVIASVYITSCGSGSGSGKGQDSVKKDTGATHKPLVTTISVLYTKDTNRKMVFDDQGEVGRTKRETAERVSRKIRGCVEDPTDPTSKCPTQKNCTNYCDEPECGQKALCCHGLLDEEFSAMIATHDSLFVQIPKDVLRDLANDADCGTQKIRVEFIVNSNHSMSLVLTTVDYSENIVSNYVVYYSVLLLRNLMNMTNPAPDEVYFYRGIDASGGRIVPFKVVFDNGDVRYYDLSNQHP